MPRRNPSKRNTTLKWTGPDERYNDAAMRVFVELFQVQHDEPTPEIVAVVAQVEWTMEHTSSVGKDKFDEVINELVRRRIERRVQ